MIYSSYQVTHILGSLINFYKFISHYQISVEVYATCIVGTLDCLWRRHTHMYQNIYEDIYISIIKYINRKRFQYYMVTYSFSACISLHDWLVQSECHNQSIKSQLSDVCKFVAVFGWYVFNPS